MARIEPSAFKANPFVVVLGKKPAWEAKSFSECRLSATLSIPMKDPKLVFVCREITPTSAWLKAAAPMKPVLCVGCNRYHIWFIFYFK